MESFSISYTWYTILILPLNHYEIVHVSKLKMGVKREGSLISKNRAAAKRRIYFHAFTWCMHLQAQTGEENFPGITKRKWMKLFLELDDSDEILDALSYLGESLEDPNGEVIEALEKFVCRAYSPKTKCISLKKLRWELFRTGKESEKLPPTKSSFIPHIRRSNYQSYIWKSCKLPEMSISSPVGHGWDDKDTSIMPIMCLKSPAPQALLELVKCGCKGKCDKRQCSCVRNNIHCTPTCLCGDCHNQDDAEKSADDGIGDESSSDETGDEEF
ncbi:hypothetical protein GQR58_019139 [Nymphon striatum]|nr:hypothetical protein GQR58_019139 [Nymphon striatum]